MQAIAQFDMQALPHRTLGSREDLRMPNAVTVAKATNSSAGVWQTTNNKDSQLHFLAVGWGSSLLLPSHRIRNRHGLL